MRILANTTAIMRLRLLSLLLFILGASATSRQHFLPFQKDYDSVQPPATSAPNFEVFDDFLGALRVMQDAYFQPWLGSWPSAIDWTAAALGTHMSAAMSSLSLGLERFGASEIDDYKAKENFITSYFSQVLSYYFGQDTFAIKNEAFDDMLWVVLGWLETIQFVNFHTTIYYPSATAQTHPAQDVSEILRNQTWYGNLWTPAFAHRSRIFWDFAEKGWDTKLCGGGMNWNPRLQPYKNAITNELFIAASVSMYLYFPGDVNASPFINPKFPTMTDPNATKPVEPRQQKHLNAALAGYLWLTGSGMLNSQGLYIDGFHISGTKNGTRPSTKCDVRNEMVYTYNQGVILTGQIGLWKATGHDGFLRDGHRLIQSVITATGYDLEDDRPIDDIDDLEPGQLPPWRGLGRAGVLEEQCDVSGTCSQDSQSFKGIFFHHLTAFCAPLDISIVKRGEGAESSALTQARDAHASACSAYVGWIRHNAVAALSTKDSAGKFGMWWTVGLLNITTASIKAQDEVPPSDGHSEDYRTYGVPNDDVWIPRNGGSGTATKYRFGVPNQAPMNRRTKHAPASRSSELRRAVTGGPSDPNTRGRGRTVETQGGGLAVLRALWEISNRAGA